LVNETYLLKNTNYEKTDKLNFNSTIQQWFTKDKQPNQTKEWLKKAFVLIRQQLKLEYVPVILLNLEYIQFKENKNIQIHLH
jgi:hypothetical protein